MSAPMKALGFHDIPNEAGTKPTSPGCAIVRQPEAYREPAKPPAWKSNVRELPLAANRVTRASPLLYIHKG